MKLNPIVMALILASMSLAGCVSQSDGTAEVTLTDDQVDQILDERFDDFMENTTVEINDQSSDSNQFFNNSSTTNHNYNNESVYNSGAVYNNVSGFNQVEYFVVDYRFNKSDLTNTPAPPPVDHVNNTFTVDLNGTDWGSNNSNNSNNSGSPSLDYGEITLPCSGYYIVGQNLGNGNTYWMSSSNYYYEWTMLYNQTIADIYQDNAWDTYVRNLCDDNYTANSQNSANQRLTILQIDIPAGKAIKCQNPPSLYSFHAHQGYYHTAYGELQGGYFGAVSVNGLYYKQVYLRQQWEDIFATQCSGYYYGNGDTSSQFIFSSSDLAEGVQYRLYLVYSLSDVSQHQ